MPTVIPVRTHYSSEDLWFDPGRSGAVEGDHVVVSTERGTEFGLATSDPFEAPAEEVKGKLKSVIRVANEDDVAQAETLARKGDEAMPIFRRLVKKQELDMKPVGVEFLFGGEKAVFYFAAEERVDFRELVRELSSQFRTRVDMRQIGVRDETRLRGGYATCGQELCCTRMGGRFEPVSIRMAKEQDLPLNSAKISGVCGRLMCCLRYEFEAYRDFKSRAPKRNAVIDTPLGKAKIVEYNTPRETMTMRLENGKSFTVALADMAASPACCKKAKEQNVPLRPDTVGREALEKFGSAEIKAQLAELDRLAEPNRGFELDTSLVSPRRRSRIQRQQEAAAAESMAGEEGQARTRSQSHRDRSEGEDGLEGIIRRRTRKAAGAGAGRAADLAEPTRPGRGSRAQAPEDQAAYDEQGRDTRPQRRRGMQPRHQSAGRAQAEGRKGAAEGAPARRQRTAPAASAQASQVDDQTRARRTRRHHTVAGGTDAASVPQERAQTRTRTESGDAQGETRQRTPRQRGPQSQDRPAQSRTSPASTSAAGQDDQARLVRRRHRHPGDKGGQADTPSDQQ